MTQRKEHQSAASGGFLLLWVSMGWGGGGGSNVWGLETELESRLTYPVSSE